MMFRSVPICIVLIFYVCTAWGNFPVSFVTPESCNSTEYFDSVCMRCKRCGRNDTQASQQRRSYDGSCVCESKHYEKSRKGPHDVTCIPCPNGTEVSLDGKICLKCTEHNPYNETTGHCQPCENGAFVENGQYLICTACEKPVLSLSMPESVCRNSETASPIYCSQMNMVYSGGSCLSNLQAAPSLTTIVYSGLESIVSAFLKEHVNAALQNCEAHNETACQVLANMCALSLYRVSLETNACLEFMKISKKYLEECPRNQWLYYLDENSRRNPEKVLSRKNVPNVFTPSLTQQNSQIHIFAKQYTANGSFIGLFKLTSDDISLCQESDLEEDISFIIGTRFERTCKQSIQKLWQSTDVKFFDLYLGNSANQTELYPIPVLIRNVLVNDEPVNKEEDVSKWLLVQRFFLTDALSGQEEASKQAKIFRYASDIRLSIRFRNDGESGRIYPPLLILTYSQATLHDYLNNKKVTVNFSVSYEMDHSSAMKSISTVVAVLSLFAICWSILQTFSWFRRSGKHAIDLLTLGKFGIFASGNLSITFFVVMFGTCIYWFAFFKRQEVIYTLLPTPEQEYFLHVYIGLAFALKAIHLIHLLVVQCSIDIFFVDWERPRATSNTRRPPPGTDKGEMGVSIWRTYYAANEWAEMASQRRVSPGWQLFGVLFMLKVLSLESFTVSALVSPSMYVPYSGCCRFAMGAAVFIFLALAQVIFRRGVYERFIEDKLQQYVDLCSVSNVSVFILVSKRFGYYIHGRSTHGKADVNMKEMHDFLRKEEEDLCGRRGLLPDTDQQTFQILLPPGVHDQFLRLLVPLTTYSQAADRMQGVGGRLAKVDIDRVANTHYMLNKFLAGFIDHSFKDLDYIVKDKVLLEYVLDIECIEVAERGYFYNDDGRSFSSVLFLGCESTLLLFDLLLFCLIDLTSHNYVLASLLTFATAKVVQWLRQSAGRRNLVRKALIDERFLI